MASPGATPGSNATKGGKNNSDDLFNFASSAQEDLNNESIENLETIDAFVGPVKKEFDDLKRKIDEKDQELIKLETDFYKRVSSKAVELEGIGPEEEKEIERHRHLFEMQ